MKIARKRSYEEGVRENEACKINLGGGSTEHIVEGKSVQKAVRYLGASSGPMSHPQSTEEAISRHPRGT